jgi:hypothetical protein
VGRSLFLTFQMRNKVGLVRGMRRYDSDRRSVVAFLTLGGIVEDPLSRVQAFHRGTEPNATHVTINFLHFGSNFRSRRSLLLAQNDDGSKSLLTWSFDNAQNILF